jgi:hypothetical protein
LDPYWGPNIKDASIYDLTRLLALQARYEAETGQTDIAMQDVMRLFVITHHLSATPLNNSSRVILGRTRLADQTLAKVLLSASLSPTQARAFEASLPEVNMDVPSEWDFLIDRITNINAFESSSWPYILFDDNFPAEKSLYTFRGMLRFVTNPVRKLDEVSTLQFTYESYKEVPFPMTPHYREARITEEIDRIPWYAIGTKLTVDIAPSHTLEYMETYRRQRIIALALAAYRTQYHQYPPTLKSLEAFWGSALPKDLYGGKSFRYRSDGKTFHLYSIGRNWIDDGGRPPKPPYNDDIEWPNNASY